MTNKTEFKRKKVPTSVFIREAIVAPIVGVTLLVGPFFLIAGLAKVIDKLF